MVVAALAAAILAGGCSPEAGAPPKAETPQVVGYSVKKTALPKATTPQQAERNFVQCVLKADKEGFMGCLASGKGRKARGGSDVRVRAGPDRVP